MHSNSMLVSLLRRLPGLQRVNVGVASKKGYFDTALLFGALVARPTAEGPDIQPVCPQLQELYMKGSKLLVTFRELQDVINSRLRKLDTLESNDRLGPDAQETSSLVAIHLSDEVVILNENPQIAGDLDFARQWLVDADVAGVLKYSNAVGVWEDELEI